MTGMAVATAIGAIPWDKVIKYGPQIAEAAKALWNSVKSDTPSNADAGDPVVIRLDQLEAETIELHAQMLAASELIAKIAGQNALLTRRVTLLSYACVASSAIALISIVLILI